MTNKGLEYLQKIQPEFKKGLPAIDFHIHTSWTDGQHGVQEMYEEACRMNLDCILFSEHARETSSDWFHEFAAEVRALPEKPCLALVGVETRVVDFAGNINLQDNILALCDLVIGSIHRFPEKDGKRSLDVLSPEDALEIEFKLACSLLENPNINILGHPFGMAISRFAIYPSSEKYQCLMEKSLKNDIAFEVNSKYHCHPRTLVQWCKQRGTKISLGSDAHSKNEIGQILYQLSMKEPD